MRLHSLPSCGARRRGTNGKVLPGPRFVVPFFGCIVEMVMDPFGFWDRQRECALPSHWAPCFC